MNKARRISDQKGNTKFGGGNGEKRELPSGYTKIRPTEIQVKSYCGQKTLIANAVNKKNNRILTTKGKIVYLTDVAEQYQEDWKKLIDFIL